VRGDLFSPRKTVRAVDDVSFSIAKGETVGIVGESGCGKSTLARIILGLLPPSSGSVLIEGRRLAEMTRQERARVIQPVFQDPYSSLNPRQRIGEIVGLPLAAQGTVSAAERRSRVMEMLAQVGLSPDMATRLPAQLSGGQRQRVAIARALVLRPRIVVCDEPTSALDVSVQAQILNLLDDLRRALGLTIIFISHNLAVVEHLSDRVAIMYLGRLVEIAPADELFARPNHPYTQALLAEVPKLEAHQRTYKPIAGELPSPLDPPPGCAFHPRCPHAFARCKVERPVLREVAPGHVSACHLNDRA